MSQPTPNRNERELERLEAISALERGMDDPATPAVSPVPLWVHRALDWAFELGGEDGTDVHNILMAHFYGGQDMPRTTPTPDVSPVPPIAWSPENLEMARLFHDVYEEEAARFGWQSQTPVSFEELPEANRLTMLYTVARVRSRIAKTVYSELIEQINELESSAPPVAPSVGRQEILSWLQERIDQHCFEGIHALETNDPSEREHHWRSQEALDIFEHIIKSSPAPSVVELK
jgi:hypothetical protein